MFNFYEPLHYFQHNGGFQTWELSPEFGIRSWAYVLLHWPMANLVPRLMRFTKVCFTSNPCFGSKAPTHAAGIG